MAWQEKEKMTPLFMGYCARLLARTAVFAWALWLFVTTPDELDPTKNFGIEGGFNPIDFIFLAIVMDISTKLMPNAKIAMGSLKQYGHYHIPTAKTFDGGRAAMVQFVQKLMDDGVLKTAVDVANLATEKAQDVTVTVTHGTVTYVHETVVNVQNIALSLLKDAHLTRLLPFEPEHLTAEEELRTIIAKDRARETIPVIIFWVVFNVLVGWGLAHFGLLTQPVLVLWTLFYFLFDMICVVLWCPLQLLLMRNRCCTTCQIFNWDGIMTVTPLFVSGTLFAWLLIPLAAFVLVRWELAFYRYPERFDERTNASLRCANCTDKLCHVRPPLFDKRLGKTE